MGLNVKVFRSKSTDTAPLENREHFHRPAINGQLTFFGFQFSSSTGKFVIVSWETDFKEGNSTDLRIAVSKLRGCFDLETRLIGFKRSAEALRLKKRIEPL